MAEAAFFRTVLTFSKISIDLQILDHSSVWLILNRSLDHRTNALTVVNSYDSIHNDILCVERGQHAQLRAFIRSKVRNLKAFLPCTSSRVHQCTSTILAFIHRVNNIPSERLLCFGLTAIVTMHCHTCRYNSGNDVVDD